MLNDLSLPILKIPLEEVIELAGEENWNYKTMKDVLENAKDVAME